MKKKILRTLGLFLVLLGVTSCNIYSPFAQKSSTQDLVEEGQRCMHDGDYACAEEAYTAIPDAEVKNEKLCKMFLTKGGMTLSFLIDTVTNNSSKMLGELAQGLVPWTQAKSDALDSAKTACANYVSSTTTSASANQATLLQSVGLLVHCAIRVAKTDVYVATSNSDTACNTAGGGNGTISQSDIGDNADGTITSRGMCAADASMCTTDISSMSASSLSAAGLSAIADALNAIPAALRTSSSTAIASRGAIRDAVN